MLLIELIPNDEDEDEDRNNNPIIKQNGNFFKNQFGLH